MEIGTFIFIAGLAGVLILISGVIAWRLTQIEEHTRDTVNELTEHRRIALRMQAATTRPQTQTNAAGRCPVFIKGEQCSLKEGHEGGHKWSNGD